MTRPRLKQQTRCSFCGMTEKETGPTIAGPNVFICEGCNRIVTEAFESRRLCGPPTRPSYYAPAPERISRAPHPPTEWDVKGSIYFVLAPSSNRIKIGFSVNPAKRIEAILTGCPERLAVLGVIPGTIPEEHALHHRFAPARVHREWFNATPELRSYIREATAR